MGGSEETRKSGVRGDEREMKQDEILDSGLSLDPFDAGKAHFWGTVLGEIVSIVIGVVIIWFSMTPNISEISEESPVLLFVDFVAVAISYIVMIIVLTSAGKKKGLSFGETFRLKKVDLEASHILLLVVLGIAIIYVEALVFAGIDLLLKGKLLEWATAVVPSPGELSVLVVVRMVLIVPIVEEMVFRGFFLNAFSDWGQEWAVIFLAIFFALLHNPLAMIGAFVIAVVSGILAVKYDSIVPGILIHVGANLAGAGLPYVEVISSRSVYLIVVSVVIVGTIATLFFSRSEVSLLWQDFKLFWSQFRQDPEGWQKFKSLAKHWAWLLEFISIGLTWASIVVGTIKWL